MANSQPHSDLLTYVGLKTLEPRRYSHALTRFYKCLYNMGLNNIKEMFLSRNNKYDLRGFCKLNQPTYNSPQGYGTICLTICKESFIP